MDIIIILAKLYSPRYFISYTAQKLAAILPCYAILLKCYNVYNVITILLKRYVAAIFVMLLQDWKLLEYYCKIAAILLEWSVWSSFDLQFLTHSCNVYVYVALRLYLELIALSWKSLSASVLRSKSSLGYHSIPSPPTPACLRFASPNNPPLSSICAVDDGGYDSSLSLIAKASANDPTER